MYNARSSHDATLGENDRAPFPGDSEALTLAHIKQLEAALRAAKEKIDADDSAKAVLHTQLQDITYRSERANAHYREEIHHSSRIISLMQSSCYKQPGNPAMVLYELEHRILPPVSLAFLLERYRRGLPQVQQSLTVLQNQLHHRKSAFISNHMPVNVVVLVKTGDSWTMVSATQSTRLHVGDVSANRSNTTGIRSEYIQFRSTYLDDVLVQQSQSSHTTSSFNYSIRPANLVFPPEVLRFIDHTRETLERREIEAIADTLGSTINRECIRNSSKLGAEADDHGMEVCVLSSVACKTCSFVIVPCNLVARLVALATCAIDSFSPSKEDFDQHAAGVSLKEVVGTAIDAANITLREHVRAISSLAKDIRDETLHGTEHIARHTTDIDYYSHSGSPPTTASRLKGSRSGDFRELVDGKDGSNNAMEGGDTRFVDHKLSEVLEFATALSMDSLLGLFQREEEARQLFLSNLQSVVDRLLLLVHESVVDEEDTEEVAFLDMPAEGFDDLNRCDWRSAIPRAIASAVGGYLQSRLSLPYRSGSKHERGATTVECEILFSIIDSATTHSSPGRFNDPISHQLVVACSSQQLLVLSSPSAESNRSVSITSPGAESYAHNHHRTAYLSKGFSHAEDSMCYVRNGDSTVAAAALFAREPAITTVSSMLSTDNDDDHGGNVDNIPPRLRGDRVCDVLLGIGAVSRLDDRRFSSSERMMKTIKGIHKTLLTIPISDQQSRASKYTNPAVSAAESALLESVAAAVVVEIDTSVLENQHSIEVLERVFAEICAILHDVLSRSIVRTLVAATVRSSLFVAPTQSLAVDNSNKACCGLFGLLNLTALLPMPHPVIADSSRNRRREGGRGTHAAHLRQGNSSDRRQVSRPFEDNEDSETSDSRMRLEELTTESGPGLRTNYVNSKKGSARNGGKRSRSPTKSRHESTRRRKESSWYKLQDASTAREQAVAVLSQYFHAGNDIFTASNIDSENDESDDECTAVVQLSQSLSTVLNCEWNMFILASTNTYQGGGKSTNDASPIANYLSVSSAFGKSESTVGAVGLRDDREKGLLPRQPKQLLVLNPYSDIFSPTADRHYENRPLLSDMLPSSAAQTVNARTLQALGCTRLGAFASSWTDLDDDDDTGSQSTAARVTDAESGSGQGGYSRGRRLCEEKCLLSTVRSAGGTDPANSETEVRVSVLRYFRAHQSPHTPHQIYQQGRGLGRNDHPGDQQQKQDSYRLQGVAMLLSQEYLPLLLHLDNTTTVHNLPTREAATHREGQSRTRSRSPSHSRSRNDSRRQGRGRTGSSSREHRYAATGGRMQEYRQSKHSRLVETVCGSAFHHSVAIKLQVINFQQQRPLSPQSSPSSHIGTATSTRNRREGREGREGGGAVESDFAEEETKASPVHNSSNVLIHRHRQHETVKLDIVIVLGRCWIPYSMPEIRGFADELTSLVFLSLQRWRLRFTQDLLLSTRRYFQLERAEKEKALREQRAKQAESDTNIQFLRSEKAFLLKEVNAINQKLSKFGGASLDRRTIDSSDSAPLAGVTANTVPRDMHDEASIKGVHFHQLPVKGAVHGSVGSAETVSGLDDSYLAGADIATCQLLTRSAHKAIGNALEALRITAQKCKEERIVCDDFFKQLVAVHKKHEDARSHFHLFQSTLAAAVGQPSCSYSSSSSATATTAAVSRLNLTAPQTQRQSISGLRTAAGGEAGGEAGSIEVQSNAGSKAVEAAEGERSGKEREFSATLELLSKVHYLSASMTRLEELVAEHGLSTAAVHALADTKDLAASRLRTLLSTSFSPTNTTTHRERETGTHSMAGARARAEESVPLSERAELFLRGGVLGRAFDASNNDSRALHASNPELVRHNIAKQQLLAQVMGSSYFFSSSSALNASAPLPFSREKTVVFWCFDTPLPSALPNSAAATGALSAGHFLSVADPTVMSAGDLDLHDRLEHIRAHWHAENPFSARVTGNPAAVSPEESDLSRHVVTWEDTPIHTGAFMKALLAPPNSFPQTAVRVSHVMLPRPYAAELLDSEDHKNNSSHTHSHSHSLAYPLSAMNHPEGYSDQQRIDLVVDLTYTPIYPTHTNDSLAQQQRRARRSEGPVAIVQHAVVHLADTDRDIIDDNNNNNNTSSKGRRNMADRELEEITSSAMEDTFVQFLGRMATAENLHPQHRPHHSAAADSDSHSSNSNDPHVDAIAGGHGYERSYIGRERLNGDDDGRFDTRSPLSGSSFMVSAGKKDGDRAAGIAPLDHHYLSTHTNTHSSTHTSSRIHRRSDSAIHHDHDHHHNDNNNANNSSHHRARDVSRKQPPHLSLQRRVEYLLSHPVVSELQQEHILATAYSDSSLRHFPNDATSAADARGGSSSSGSDPHSLQLRALYAALKVVGDSVLSTTALTAGTADSPSSATGNLPSILPAISALLLDRFTAASGAQKRMKTHLDVAVLLPIPEKRRTASGIEIRSSDLKGGAVPVSMAPERFVGSHHWEGAAAAVGGGSGGASAGKIVGSRVKQRVVEVFEEEHAHALREMYPQQQPQAFDSANDGSSRNGGRGTTRVRFGQKGRFEGVNMDESFVFYEASVLRFGRTISGTPFEPAVSSTSSAAIRMAAKKRKRRILMRKIDILGYFSHLFADFCSFDGVHVLGDNNDVDDALMQHGGLLSTLPRQSLLLVVEMDRKVSDHDSALLAEVSETVKRSVLKPVMDRCMYAVQQQEARAAAARVESLSEEKALLSAVLDTERAQNKFLSALQVSCRESVQREVEHTRVMRTEGVSSTIQAVSGGKIGGIGGETGNSVFDKNEFLQLVPGAASVDILSVHMPRSYTAAEFGLSGDSKQPGQVLYASDFYSPDRAIALAVRLGGRQQSSNLGGNILQGTEGGGITFSSTATEHFAALLSLHTHCPVVMDVNSSNEHSDFQIIYPIIACVDELKDDNIYRSLPQQDSATGHHVLRVAFANNVARERYVQVLETAAEMSAGLAGRGSAVGSVGDSARQIRQKLGNRDEIEFMSGGKRITDSTQEQANPTFLAHVSERLATYFWSLEAAMREERAESLALACRNFAEYGASAGRALQQQLNLNRSNQLTPSEVAFAVERSCASQQHPHSGPTTPRLLSVCNARLHWLNKGANDWSTNARAEAKTHTHSSGNHSRLLDYMRQFSRTPSQHHPLNSVDRSARQADETPLTATFSTPMPPSGSTPAEESGDFAFVWMDRIEGSSAAADEGSALSKAFTGGGFGSLSNQPNVLLLADTSSSFSHRTATATTATTGEGSASRSFYLLIDAITAIRKLLFQANARFSYFADAREDEALLPFAAVTLVLELHLSTSSSLPSVTSSAVLSHTARCNSLMKDVLLQSDAVVKLLQDAVSSLLFTHSVLLPLHHRFHRCQLALEADARTRLSVLSQCVLALSNEGSSIDSLFFELQAILTKLLPYVHSVTVTCTDTAGNALLYQCTTYNTEEGIETDHKFIPSLQAATQEAAVAVGGGVRGGEGEGVTLPHINSNLSAAAIGSGEYRSGVSVRRSQRSPTRTRTVSPNGVRLSSSVHSSLPGQPGRGEGDGEEEYVEESAGSLIGRHSHNYNTTGPYNTRYLDISTPTSSSASGYLNSIIDAGSPGRGDRSTSSPLRASMLHTATPPATATATAAASGAAASLMPDERGVGGRERALSAAAGGKDVPPQSIVQVRDYQFDCYEVSGSINITYHIPAALGPAASASDDALLVETVTRALARRAFELHRGNKNKVWMSDRQHELEQKNQQLAEDQVAFERLKRLNSMNAKELQAAAFESERVRTVMLSEQKMLKESLRQRKEMIEQLKASLVDLRRESEKSSRGMTKQITEQKEILLAMEIEAERRRKEIDRAREKEKHLELHRSELSSKVAAQQKQLNAVQAELKQRKFELHSAEQELTSALRREQAIQGQEGAKLGVLLDRVKLLEDEVVSYRNNNAFLKKQVEASALTVQQIDSARSSTESRLQQDLDKALLAASSAEQRLQEVKQELRSSEENLFTITRSLQTERSRAEELRLKLETVQQDRDRLLRGWSHLRAQIS